MPFVIKTNNGSGYNVFFRKPKKNLKQQIKSKIPLLKKWQKNNYGNHFLLPWKFREPHYKYIYPRLILVEEYLEHFFEISILIEDGKLVKSHEHNICFPHILRTLYKVSTQIFYLTQIPFFRVDFYITQEKIYLSEISFTPENCFYL